jgi:hypothetical protein
MARKDKLTPGEVQSALTRLVGDKVRAIHLRPRASEAAIQSMQKDARRDLGEPVPEEYLSLLRITNGLQINGAYFKEAENLVLENLDLSFPEIIVLGNDGNMAQYVFDKRDRRFHTINMGFPDEKFESFDTFDEMLLAVMREQQAL